MPIEAGDFCVYCGALEDLTNDHVPPANIFPDPKPSNLITVRACRSCNAGASKDDEYFRMMLSLTQDVGDSQEAQKNWEPILRSLRRPQGQGMTKTLLRSIHPVDAITWGGIHLGTRMGFNVNLERIHRVVERTARGLYYHELKRRLPDGYKVWVHSDDTLSHAPSDVLKNLQETILIPLAAMQPTMIAPGVFFYRFHVDQEDPGLSVWALTFYERKSFLAMTVPVSSPAPALT